jgi:GAF domain-containing protein
MTDPRFAAAAGIMPAEHQHRALLQSIVDTARAIFGAGAASIFLYDEETDELVFEAVAGASAGQLVGTRIPSGTGIAGWVLVTRQPIVLSDLEKDPRFARDVAERTGYVPKALMAAPLLYEESSLGVLQVLDPEQEPSFTLAEMDLLGLFASQAAIALDLLRRARRARALIDGQGGDAAAVAALAAALEGLEEDRREPAVSRLRALAELLRGT